MQASAPKEVREDFRDQGPVPSGTGGRVELWRHFILGLPANASASADYALYRGGCRPRRSSAGRRRHVLGQPVVVATLEFPDLLFGFVLADAVRLLDLPGEHVAFAGDDVRLSSVSLPHSCFTLPLNCFQLPSTRSQFMSDLLGWCLCKCGARAGLAQPRVCSSGAARVPKGASCGNNYLPDRCADAVGENRAAAGNICSIRGRPE